jgi:hypothetical protein
MANARSPWCAWECSRISVAGRVRVLHPLDSERTVAEATETNNPGISGAHNVARPRE